MMFIVSLQCHKIRYENQVVHSLDCAECKMSNTPGVSCAVMLGKGINGARNNLRSIPQSCTLYQQLMWYNSKLTELDDAMKINMQNSPSCQSCRLFFASIDSFPLTMNCLQLLDNLTYRSSFAVTSSENTDSIAVIAWDAVFSVSSKAPAIIVVSSCVNSPPFPA